jgi:hypothetical protein
MRSLTRLRDISSDEMAFIEISLTENQNLPQSLEMFVLKYTTSLAL